MSGLSLRQAAKKIGISPIRLSQWERDIRKPGIDNLVKLAVLYYVMVDKLVFDLRKESVTSIHGTPGKLYGEYYQKIKEKPP